MEVLWTIPLKEVDYILWKQFTVIPCGPKHLYRCLKTFGSQIETEGLLKIEKAM